VVWFLDLPASRENELIDRARSLGVGVYSVRTLSNPSLSTLRKDLIGLVMGYASLDPEWIIHGVTLLQKAAATL
jgi:hypothetical protein